MTRELRVAQVARDKGSIAAKPKLLVENGRRQELGIALGVEGPVPKRLTQSAVPTAFPKRLFVLQEQETVERIKDALVMGVSVRKKERKKETKKERKRHRTTTTYSKVDSLSLDNMRSHKILIPVAHGSHASSGRLLHQALHRLDVLFLLRVAQIAPVCIAPARLFLVRYIYIYI